MKGNYTPSIRSTAKSSEIHEVILLKKILTNKIQTENINECILRQDSHATQNL